MHLGNDYGVYGVDDDSILYYVRLQMRVEMLDDSEDVISFEAGEVVQLDDETAIYLIDNGYARRCSDRRTAQASDSDRPLAEEP